MTSRKQLHEQLWSGAQQARANSSLKLNEISEPILGLIFLKFADIRFKRAQKEIEAERAKQTSGRQRPISENDYKARGVMFVPEEATYSYLMHLREGENMGKAVNTAMKLIEAANTDLAGVLPQSYTTFSKKTDENNQILISLLKTFNDIPDTIEGDALGEIYEYFLGQFALKEGQNGGEFFTAQSIVKLLVEVIEPYHGKIFDPACGSGGMFVQSANFIAKHTNKKDVMNEVTIYGQEKTSATVNIAKMNLAIHGLSGNIKESNSYYEDVHNSIGKFDFVLANPPFNIKGKDKRGQTVIDPARLKNDRRFYLGLPENQKGEIINANYLWMQMFASALNDKGRAGFVMHNNASDSGGIEREIRKKIVESGIVDVLIAVGGNMFLNVTLSATLWFFDKQKPSTQRKDTVLFINAHELFTPIPGDRTKRCWTDEQVQIIADVVKSYRGEKGYPKYEDKDGFCKSINLAEIRENNYSLNPFRYIDHVEKNDQLLTARKFLPLLDEFLSEERPEFIEAEKQAVSVIEKYIPDINSENIKFVSASMVDKLLDSIFKSWFIDFQFSNKGDINLVDSNTNFGLIPEGWEIKTVEQQIKRISPGKKYSNKTVKESGLVPVLDQGKSGVIGYHNDEPGVKATIDDPVIVFANHTCYQNLITFDFSAIQNVLPFKPSDSSNIFWLHWATKDLIEFNDYKGHWPEFIAKKFIVPNPELTNIFGEIAKKLLTLKLLHDRQSARFDAFVSSKS